MNLSDLIKNGIAGIATAIPAIPATDALGKSGTVATIATVAVANPANLKSFDREWFEERAAIMEYDGGLSRSEAERLAMIEVTSGSSTVH